MPYLCSQRKWDNNATCCGKTNLSSGAQAGSGDGAKADGGVSITVGAEAQPNTD